MQRNPNAGFPVQNMEENAVQVKNILEGCRQKNRTSQQQLYALYYNYAMTIARRYVHHTDRAEEVVNDAFFKVFTKLHLFSADQPFRPWLRRIIINTAIDAIRSKLRIPHEAELTAINEPGVQIDVEENITREQIWGMLDKLPPAYRTVFNMAVVDGFTHEEISDALQISVGTSKSNLARARQYLKKLLKDEFEFFN